MADVKPAEVSAILREQLSGFKTEAQLEEIGTAVIDNSTDPIVAPNGYQIGYAMPRNGDEYMDALVKNFTYWDKDLSKQEVTASLNNVTLFLPLDY